MRWQIIPAALFAAGALALDASAQSEVVAEPGEAHVAERPYRLTFDHITGRFRLDDEKGRETVWESRGWGRGQATLAPVPAGRPLEVVIVNANSLLYEYSVATEPVGQQRVRSCRDVGTGFLSTGFVIGSQAIAGAGAQLPSFDDLQQDLQALDPGPRSPDKSFELDDAPADARAARESALAAAYTSYQQYQALTGAIQHLAGTFGDSLEVLALRAEAAPVEQLIDGLEQSMERTWPGLSDPRRIPSLVIVKEQEIRAHVRDAALGQGDDLAMQALGIAEAVNAAAAQSRADAVLLQQQLVKLAAARAGATRSFTVLPSGSYRKLTVTLKPVDDTDVFRSRVGEVVTFIRPVASLICELSFGMTWMERPASYAVDGDGRIIDEGDADTRTSAALMFHFAAPAVPQLGALVGVGLGSEHSPDLYAGLTIRTLKPVLINTGMVWQRVRVLPDGVARGEVVEDDSFLADLDRRYRAGWFFGLGLGR